MKLILPILLMSIQGFQLEQNVENYQQCLPVMLMTAYQGYKVYQDVLAKSNDMIFFDGLDVVKLMYMDYKCLTEKESFEILKKDFDISDDLEKCMREHFRASFHLINEGIKKITEGKKEEAMELFKKGAAEFALIFSCIHN